MRLCLSEDIGVDRRISTRSARRRGVVPVLATPVLPGAVRLLERHQIAFDLHDGATAFRFHCQRRYNCELIKLDVASERTSQ